MAYSVNINKLKAIDMDWDEEIDTNYTNTITISGLSEDVFIGKTEQKLIQALEALEATGGLDFAVLKYPELGEVWGKYTRRREEQRQRAAAIEKLKSTFSKKEMQLLGIQELVK